MTKVFSVFLINVWCSWLLELHIFWMWLLSKDCLKCKKPWNLVFLRLFFLKQELESATKQFYVFLINLAWSYLVQLKISRKRVLFWWFFCKAKTKECQKSKVFLTNFECTCLVQLYNFCTRFTQISHHRFLWSKKFEAICWMQKIWKIYNLFNQIFSLEMSALVSFDICLIFLERLYMSELQISWKWLRTFHWK